MDTLGKAYGQLPTVCTPFQLQHVGSSCAPVFFSLFLERKRSIFLFTVLSYPGKILGGLDLGGIYYQ